MQRVHVIDSHTGGEPTRTVIAGGPHLGAGSISERLDIFQRDFDGFRSAIVNEPRGSDVMVGALLTPPKDPASAAGVIFFNNVGYLGMCGHGTIGVITTLGHLGRIAPGEHRIETPVGVVGATLHGDGRVSVRNVASFRMARNVAVAVDGLGTITGDVAWGGNNFFLVGEHGQRLELSNVEALTDFTWRIRQALADNGIVGLKGGEIDHIELFGPPCGPDADSRSFVLCPGKAYDRSPCGTGTSAKLACLFADGKLAQGAVWRQESIVGSLFEGTVERVGDDLIPTITGRAFVNAESTFLLDPADPFCYGIR
jgi:4-hydroxyproline epimerase